VAIDAELYPWLSAGAIAWGLVDCFFGYRVFKVTITVWGVLLGMIFGEAAGQALGLGTAGKIGGLVVGGLAGGGLAFLLYLVAVFVVGFLFGATLGLLILANFNHNVAVATSCVLGVIGGVLAVKLQRVVLILSTSLLGSFRAFLALMYFTQRLDWTYYLFQRPQQLPALIEGNTWLFPSVLVLAAVGAMAQLELGGGRNAKPKALAGGKE
jgi:hypothetical protein